MSDKRKSTTHLPKFFNTVANRKFLSSTFDQLTQPGMVEKINGYIGKKHTKNYKNTDYYLEDVTDNRQHKQLESASVIKDELDNVLFYKDYNDLVNGLYNNNVNTTNESRLCSEEYYPWEPHINWDKLVNYHQYYWMPDGPPTILIDGVGPERACTNIVTVNNGFVFSSYDVVNPSIIMYRNLEYTLDINTNNSFLSIRSTSNTYLHWKPNTNYMVNDIIIYNGLLYKCIEDHTSTFDIDLLYWNKENNLESYVSKQYVNNDLIKIVLDDTAPDTLYYIDDNNPTFVGTIIVKDLTNDKLNIDNDLIGKKEYFIDDKTKLSNGMKVTFGPNTFPIYYQNKEWIINGVGNKIELIDYDSLCKNCNITAPEYLTIEIGANDGNIWSRNNRWYHKSIIESAYKYNDIVPTYNHNNRARRPIIEFNKGLRLFNYGTKLKQEVDLIDDFTSDIFTTIESSYGYNIDGVDLQDGMTLLFTNDKYEENNNKIYKVNVIPYGTTNVISLVEVPGSKTEVNNTVYAKYGNKYGESVVWRTEDGWKIAQQKTKINQAPLFTVYDQNNIELTDPVEYPYSTFCGTKIFSYKINPNTTDNILDFGITYQSIENIGDIVFEFDYNTQLFSYRDKNENIITNSVKNGHLRKYNTIYNYDIITGYTNSNTLSKQAIERSINVDDTLSNYTINVFAVPVNISDYTIKVYKNSELLDNSRYNINKVNTSHNITFKSPLEKNDNLLVKVYTNKRTKSTELFDVPINLENNPNNKDLSTLTYSEIITHVKSIAENINEFRGTIPGDTNLRDLYNISKYGTKIIKHSSPLNMVMYHLLSNDDNLLNAIDICKYAYNNFKNEFIRLATDKNLNGNLKEQVDSILKTINHGKDTTDKFYFSDMVAYNSPIVNTYTINNSSQIYFPLSIENPRSISNNSTINVYINDIQLIINNDYTINDDDFVVLRKHVNKDDIVAIYEYETTYGSYIPSTPSKLGLYPSVVPKKITDDTYLTPQEVIIGHDGSKLLAFNDYRDDLLLELEKRIYNNIKKSNSTFNLFEYLPGLYRNTELSIYELEYTLLNDFNKWNSGIESDYSLNTIYMEGEPFTYNYVNAIDHNGNIINGTWKNIYQKAYDTIEPHREPWKMLGYSNIPYWWATTYGNPPYTSNNITLWNDIENGIIREPGNQRQNVLFERPNLTSHLPVNKQGKLLDPITSKFIRTYESKTLANDFKYGDGSTVEITWKNSSDYRYALLKALLLNFPSRIFAYGFDTFRQYYNNNILSYNDTYMAGRNIKMPTSIGDTDNTICSGLINFIRDAYTSENNTIYNSYKQNIKHIENKLGAKLAGYTTKDKFKLLFDSKKPSKNHSLIISPKSYSIFLNSSTPVQIKSYSGIIIERHPSGFLLNGLNDKNPVFKYNKCVDNPEDRTKNIGGVSEHFTIWESNKTYTLNRIVKYQTTYYRVTKYHTTGTKFEPENYASMPFLPIVGGKTIKYRNSFHDQEYSMIYGTIIPTVQEVVDFMYGYEHALEKEGFEFNGRNEDGTIQDWQSSVHEFVMWSLDNTSDAIAVSPGAKTIEVKSSYSMLSALNGSYDEYLLYNVDGSKINKNDIIIDRNESNNFNIMTLSDTGGVYGGNLEFIQKEHVLLFDDFTEFNEIIYNQVTGFRQPRIKINGYRTAEWDGSLNIPGFIYDNGIVTQWTPWKAYNIGDTVKYKEFYYTANTKVYGSNKFDIKEWILLSEKPESGLLPNLEYKINQFEDFYDLDTDNFDKEQQKFAQHLIGYQSRPYLQNIIEDEVSQYKLYQGFIQDKGTKNAILKVFDPISSNITIDEEWAIKTGTYGALNGLHELTFPLQEYKSEPQTLQIVKNKTYYDNKNPLVQYFNEKDILYLDQKQNTLVSTTDNEFILPKIGTVNTTHVEHIVNDYSNIPNLLDVNNTDHIWVTKPGNKWDVVFQSATNSHIYEITSYNNDKLTVKVENNTLKENNIIIIRNNTFIHGTYTVLSSNDDIVELFSHQKLSDVSSTACFANIGKYETCRFSNTTSANEHLTKTEQRTDKLWIDDTINGWQVVRQKEKFNHVNSLINDQINPQKSLFGTGLEIDRTNTRMVVSRPDDGHGIIYVYYKLSKSSNYRLSQMIQLDTKETEYGDNIILSPDNVYIIVSHSVASFDGTRLVGRVDVYKRTYNNKYELHKELLPDDPIESGNFGIEICYNKNNDINTLYVMSKRPNGGKIHIFKEGTVDGVYYDWEPNQDKRYKGEYDSDTPYVYDDIVTYNGTAYQALTDVIAPSSIEDDIWEIIVKGTDFTSVINTEDHLEYISNDDTTYQVNKIVTNDDNELIVSYKSSGENGGIIVIFKNINGYYTPTQKIQNNNIEFGYDINVYNDRLVISSTYEYEPKDEVFIYIKTNDEYELRQTLYAPYWNTLNRYGTKIEQSDNLIAITSTQGKQNNYATFDNGRTTFDDKFCRFHEYSDKISAINIYQKIHNYFIYSHTINFTSDGNDNFKLSKLVNDNTIHVGSIETKGNKKTCNIKEYYATDAFWEVIGEYKPTLDVSLIKDITLHDSVTHKIKANIDYIDIFQGKVANTAHDRLSYISEYDPAIYVMGDESMVNVDPSQCWLENNNGLLWWDTSSSKYMYPYQSNIIYSATTWNTPLEDNETQVYEWTESVFKPSEWDKHSEKGTGKYNYITGKSKYGDSAYSTRKKYDPVSKTFTTYYYYWVGDKKTSTEPDILSAYAVKNLINNPAINGYKFIGLINQNEFALYNCADLIDNNTTLKINYWTDNIFKNSNIHNEYKLITEHTNNYSINKTIRNKWFDSLVGQDINGNVVPDNSLREDVKYGTLSYPRQSWFKNRTEALKQLISKTNNVLKTERIVDKKNTTRLFEKEDMPNINNNLYDTRVDVLSDLLIVNTYNVKEPKLELNIVNGKVSSVLIEDPGKGYIYPPTLTIDGTGHDVIFDVTLTVDGGIEDIKIVNGGKNYSYNDKLIIRGYSVLVSNDESRHDKWSIYEYNSKTKQWKLTKLQKYDVQEYWEYIDWYAEGYNKNIKSDYLINHINELRNDDFEINSIIKILNSGKGGWELYKKVSIDNYESIGRQDGTINFSKRLYDPIEFKIKYDSISYDNNPYDLWPYKEIRIILETLRDDILTNELLVEYNKLFFSSIYYVLSENNYVDWIFKTSFIKVKYNASELKQDNLYKIDNSYNYEQYINEVKPFKTKVREYVTAYNKLHNAPMFVDDFEVNKQEFRYGAPLVYHGNIPIDTIETDVSRWYDNRGFSLKSIYVKNNSVVFSHAPTIQIIGDCITPAKASITLDDDNYIHEIYVDVSGSGYTKSPVINIMDGDTLVNIDAKAILDDSNWRLFKNKIKFDRVGITNMYNDDFVNEEFIIDSDTTSITLKWPVESARDAISIEYNGQELLYSSYTYNNIKDTEKTYTRELGNVVLLFTPEDNSTINIRYKRNINIMVAADRITNFYTQYNKEYPPHMASLMKGVEFEGVQISGGDFLDEYTWGTLPWMVKKWDIDIDDPDNYDSTINGGNLNYTNALSNSGDTVYQGSSLDGIHQPGPEELVTGTVSEAFHIKVYESDSNSAWSYFKDHSNKTHYKRIIETSTLLNDLHFDDNIITLTDTLPSSAPGVIFINGERIEYSSKSGNVLGGLIRGTNGTSIPTISLSGETAIEQGTNHSIPYTDDVTTHTITFTGKYVYMLPFIAELEDSVEVYHGGRKLRKNKIPKYDPSKALDSPEADVEVEEEYIIITNPGYDSFSLDSLEYSLSPTILGDGGYTLISFRPQYLEIMPNDGDIITLVTKKGNYWHSDGKSIATSASDIADFIKGAGF